MNSLPPQGWGEELGVMSGMVPVDQAMGPSCVQPGRGAGDHSWSAERQLPFVFVSCSGDEEPDRKEQWNRNNAKRECEWQAIIAERQYKRRNYANDVREDNDT